MYSTIRLAVLLTIVTAAAAATHDILVGNAGTEYSPNSTTAAQGDTVVFHFYPGNHNVVQGDFNKPCSTSGGFYSGFIDSKSGASGQTFTITINDTNPIWIYCSQLEHCQLGMVMVINPPSSGNTLAEYAAACAKTSSSTTPGTVEGGVIGSGSGSSSSASTASSASSSSASAASSSAASSAASASGASTPASTSASQTSASTSTGSTTSASASATGNSASVVGKDVVLSGMGAVVAVVAFWVGFV